MAVLKVPPKRRPAPNGRRDSGLLVSITAWRRTADRYNTDETSRPIPGVSNQPGVTRAHTDALRRMHDDLGAGVTRSDLGKPVGDAVEPDRALDLRLDLSVREEFAEKRFRA